MSKETNLPGEISASYFISSLTVKLANPVELLMYLHEQEVRTFDTMYTERSSDPEIAKCQEYDAMYLGRVKQEIEFFKTRVELREREFAIEEKASVMEKDRLLME